MVPLLDPSPQLVAASSAITRRTIQGSLLSPSREPTTYPVAAIAREMANRINMSIGMLSSTPSVTWSTIVAYLLDSAEVSAPLEMYLRTTWSSFTKNGFFITANGPI